MPNGYESVSESRDMRPLMISKGFEDDLPTPFVAHAAEVLGDTTAGLTGVQIVKLMRGYAAGLGRKSRTLSPRMMHLTSARPFTRTYSLSAGPRSTGYCESYVTTADLPLCRQNDSK